MLWCEDYCFVHYPKTAGKTLSRFFVQAWKNKKLAGFISPGQVDELADLELEKTGIVVGRGHENLKESAQIIRDAGYDIEAMKAVFVCIRNPYDLMVSNYHFMKETYKNNQDKKNFIIANECEFPEYCEKVGVSTPANWMTIDGEAPANLQIIRFEQLNADLRRYATEHGFPVPPLDHLNSSKRGHYSDYMCPRSEQAVYDKFTFIFENGFYERESFDDSSARQTA